MLQLHLFFLFFSLNKESKMNFWFSEEYNWQNLCSVSVSCFHNLSPSVHLILAKLWLKWTVPPQTFSQHGHSKHQSIDALQWPLTSAKACIPSPNGIEKLLSVPQRCYLLVVRQSGEAACAGSRWREARWPLSPALISYSFLEINDSCAITLQ